MLSIRIITYNIYNIRPQLADKYYNIGLFSCELLRYTGKFDKILE